MLWVRQEHSYIAILLELYEWLQTIFWHVFIAKSEFLYQGGQTHKCVRRRGEVDLAWKHTFGNKQSLIQWLYKQTKLGPKLYFFSMSTPICYSGDQFAWIRSF